MGDRPSEILESRAEIEADEALKRSIAGCSPARSGRPSRLLLAFVGLPLPRAQPASA